VRRQTATSQRISVVVVARGCPQFRAQRQTDQHRCCDYCDYYDCCSVGWRWRRRVVVVKATASAGRGRRRCTRPHQHTTTSPLHTVVVVVVSVVVAASCQHDQVRRRHDRLAGARARTSRRPCNLCCVMGRWWGGVNPNHFRDMLRCTVAQRVGGLRYVLICRVAQKVGTLTCDHNSVKS